MAEYCRDDFRMTEDNQDTFEFWQGLRGPGVPAGGTEGQYLRKLSDVDYNTEWATPDAGEISFNPIATYPGGTVGAGIKEVNSKGIPSGGSSGQYLKKASGSNYDAVWDTMDAGDIAYDESETYAAGSTGEAVSTLKAALNDLGLSVVDGKLNITFEE